MNKGGRPPKLVTNEIMDDVVTQVAMGKTVDQAIAKSGYPSKRTWYTWLDQNPELFKRWLIAKELRAHAYFDQVIELAQKLTENDAKNVTANQIRALQVAIDAYKFAAARLNPREYGERVPVNPVIPIQINTTLNLGQDGPPAKGKDSVWKLSAQPVTDEAEWVQVEAPRKRGGHKLARSSP